MNQSFPIATLVAALLTLGGLLVAGIVGTVTVSKHCERGGTRLLGVGAVWFVIVAVLVTIFFAISRDSRNHFQRIVTESPKNRQGVDKRGQTNIDPDSRDERPPDTPFPTAEPKSAAAPTSKPTGGEYDPLLPMGKSPVYDSIESNAKDVTGRPQSQLGDIRVEVQSIDPLKSGVEVSFTLNNTSNKTVYVFAGPPYHIGPYESDARPANAQSLPASASDNRGQRYYLERFHGFSEVKDVHFVGTNYFLELSPGETTSVSFAFTFVELYSGASPSDRSYFNFHIDLATVGELKPGTSLRVRSLNLTRLQSD